MKEIIAITSHPSTSSLMEMTNDMIDEISLLDIDMIYSSHYSEIPKKAIDKCRYIFFDRYNPILGFDTPKKYDYILTPLEKSNNIFKNSKVSISNTFAHFLSLKNTIEIAKNNSYDVLYSVVFDIKKFFNKKNLDKCFYPMRDNIKQQDMVVYPIEVYSWNDNGTREKKLIFDTKVFALNLKSKIVNEFFSRYNTLDDWSKLHDKWNPFLKNLFNTTQTYYVCDFLEILFTLEIINFKVKVLTEFIPNGDSGFFEALIKGRESNYDIEEERKLMNVVRT
jgi:hypothetical protein